MLYKIIKIPRRDSCSYVSSQTEISNQIEDLKGPNNHSFLPSFRSLLPPPRPSKHLPSYLLSATSKSSPVILPKIHIQPRFPRRTHTRRKREGGGGALCRGLMYVCMHVNKNLSLVVIVPVVSYLSSSARYIYPPYAVRRTLYYQSHCRNELN